MHHLIYVSKDNLCGQTTPEQLTAVGLADHAQGAETVQSQGPDGKAGTLYAWNALRGKLHYEAEQQTWIPAAKSGDLEPGRYWVGLWSDSPPSEADLRRDAILGGVDVTLGNEQPWHVAAPHFLPHHLVLQPDGSLRHEPKARYQDICLEAHRWRDRLSGDPQAVPLVDVWMFAVRCLSLNYRLPAEIASHLRLFDEENMALVLRAALTGEGV
jgi:hypothetical protein